MLHAGVFRSFIAIFCIAIGLCAAPARAQRAVPPLTAHLVDETGTLGAAERERLEARLAGIEQRQGTQIAVLMVRTTAPEDIAAFANRVGNAWKIGRRDVGDGVLVVVAKDDRRMRIEVAKALEGAIPDIAAARIIDEAMKPRFREGDFAGGLDAAIGQLSARIAGENLPVPDAGKPQGTRGERGVDWSDFAIFLFFGVMVGGPVARGIFGNRAGGLLMGGAVGLFAFLFTTSLLLAAGAGALALLYTWLFGGRGVSTGRRGGLRDGFSTGLGTGIGMGGWSSGGSHGGGSDSGGFSSGGGGDFGGGGASGDW
ncbi:TPM domain-containing protein [Acidovorax sp. GBBC 3334]|uniref:TPM domain-containing protein n=1 Tax=Acidovorax sp. GBBC 3334 TaxID=2940496 RepID=UPI002304B890|nr:TPM domain-containing protein [Acidovorax sp. GBBC 3334]MDA8456677.1 TPM domain-containing protein [Acidovorax sp. GBBC 3334]